MITGTIGEYARPTLASELIIPRFGIRRKVNFLVDTGADQTVLQPYDAQEVGIPFERLESPEVSRGIGGPALLFRESAYLTFDEDDGSATHWCLLNIHIAKPPENGAPSPLPSLLGRDVIDQWRMLYDPVDGRLEFTVRRGFAIGAGGNAIGIG